VLTWFFVAAVAPYAETGAVDYPLPLAFKKVWGTGWFLKSFSAVALSGLIVSYSGMIYATSRQAFSLGRAGYLPKILGSVHTKRRVPDVALALCTLVSILFIVLGRFYEKATAVAILISTLAAVIWYVLAMICLFVLRRKEPGLFRPYRTPAFPWLPLFVALLAAFCGYLYAWVNVQVLLPTAVLYVAAGVWYAVRGRKSVLAAAPEEVAARIAQKLAAKQGSSQAAVAGAKGMIEHITCVFLLAGLLSLVWMVLRATKIFPGPSTSGEVFIVGAIWVALFFLVSFVGFYSTRIA
jgi:ethanolamine permease